EQRAAYLAARASGLTQEAAARAAGLSRSSGAVVERAGAPRAVVRYRASGSGGLGGDAIPSSDGNGNPWADRHTGEPDPEPVDPRWLGPEAKAALDDFALFRRRYLGRGPSPWQADAAHRVLELLLAAQRSRDREYLVLNAPPGAGKSTLWHDVCVWLICRDRRIRILYGSRTTGQAMKYTARIRRTLMQRSPVVPRDEDVARGLAVPGEAALVEDFGRFRPISKGEASVWQVGGFIVAQPDQALADEKEPTVTAFGFDADYLGMRVDLAIWDDLVDLANVRTLEVIENLQETWDMVAEPRIDPGGLNVLQGQRLRHNDLYRYNLDKRRAADDDEDDDGADPDGFVPKYHHIVYPAHVEAACRERHKRTDPAFDPGDPEAGGCLLEPKRVPWRDLKTLMMKHPETYRVVFQQEDLDPQSQLIHQLWVNGGTDPKTKVHYPGCWDPDRGLWEPPPPAALVPPVHIALSIDPSPSNWWAAQLWAHVPATEKRYLVAVDRMKLDANEFLDWDRDRACFTGFLEDWWCRAVDAGLRFRHVVVEVNVAQKWLLQFDHAKRWATFRGVNFVRHQTTSLKQDDERGIPSVRELWKTGRVRLPGRPDGARQASILLVNEMLQWAPAKKAATTTDDQVMAHWFFEYTLPRLSPAVTRVRPMARPSWLRAGQLTQPASWHRMFADRKGA
ncbi:MAG: hypothetical protein LC792_01585, partial [Actinobacteria bacterium]|nr:hypothetical protein [Actinomycetota bacterium]